jgi:hypothetical protein
MCKDNASLFPSVYDGFSMLNEMVKNNEVSDGHNCSYEQQKMTRQVRL